jgi:dephospho-CoA kinase
VVLTGGIGSGKSTVAGLLTSWGAHVVDADQLAREVVAPGTPGLAAVLATFGPEVAAPDGTLDRSALAAIVFADDRRRLALEGIVHPLVEDLAEHQLASGGSAPLVVYEVPLPGRVPRFPADCLVTGPVVVVVVDAPDQVRRQRLASRGLSAMQIDDRMRAQPSREEWLAGADHVVDNGGNKAETAAQLARLWALLTGSEAPVGAEG